MFCPSKCTHSFPIFEGRNLNSEILEPYARTSRTFCIENECRMMWSVTLHNSRWLFRLETGSFVFSQANDFFRSADNPLTRDKWQLMRTSFSIGPTMSTAVSKYFSGTILYTQSMTDATFWIMVNLLARGIAIVWPVCRVQLPFYSLKKKIKLGGAREASERDSLRQDSQTSSWWRNSRIKHSTNKKQTRDPHIACFTIIIYYRFVRLSFWIHQPINSAIQHTTYN